MSEVRRSQCHEGRRGSSSKRGEDDPETLAVLAPFHPVPKMDFGELRLGSTRVRRLRCRNPSPKALLVSLECFSKEDKGFVLDYKGPFSLGPSMEACLRLGWAPKAGGSLRETVTLKYGSFKTLLQINGTALDPKGTQQPPKRGRRQQAPSNTAAPPFLPPPNPIQALLGAPPIVSMGENFPEEFHSTHKAALCQAPEGIVNPRRETYTLEGEATFAVPTLPSSKRSILSEIKHVRSQLEDCAGLSPAKPLKNTRELLNDIQADIICSPSRHSSRIEPERFQFDLESEDKENNPPRARFTTEEREEEMAYSEVVYTETIRMEEVIEEIDYEIREEGVTRFMEEEEGRLLPEVSGSHSDRRGEGHLSMEEYDEVFISPSEKEYSERELAEVSLLVAQHMQDEEELDQAQMDVLTPLSADCGEQNHFQLIQEHSVYETNIHECKESFLQATISEHHFLPMPEKGFCSTAVKDKSRISSPPSLRSSDVCKELFVEPSSHAQILNSVDNHTVMCRRDTYCLSESSSLDDRRVSSETFTKSPVADRLQTIDELVEDSSTKCNNTPTSIKKSFECPLYEEGLTFVPMSAPLSTDIEPPPMKESGVRSSKLEVTETHLRSSKQKMIASRSTSSSSPSKRDSLLKRRRTSVSSLKPHHKTSLKLIKMASNLKLNKAPSSLIRHPNLYSANNMYYDERWIEKQEKGFTKWLNFILTPWNEIFESSSDKKMDAAKLWFACSENTKLSKAPTREVMSYRAYTAGREMNNLRISAVRLWQSQKVVEVIRRLEIEIEKKRLYVRDDRCLNKDLGMKQSFLSLLLNYNPLWLRIGLETIYGEVLHVSGNSDILGISRFIITRLLSNPAISEEFIHPTVPHLHRPGYQEALKKFTLKKFLQLIFFLDYAKNMKLIKHNPCLFCKDADFKMSRDLLLDFSKRFLAGEGDVTKHLRYFGYDVSHKQTALDEFDFAVGNIAVDLRCGVRLCRVLDMILDLELTSKTRVPAISRLQKIHNINIALEALKASPLGLPDDISSKDVVNGHMEKTLNLIWHIIFGLRLSTILSKEKWAKEISLLGKSLRVRALNDASAARGLRFIREKEVEGIELETDEIVKNILTWSRLVCAHYSIEIENLSVSFSDGRALCFLLHHYYPSLLPKEEIMMNTTVSSLSSMNEEEAMTMEEARRLNDNLLSNEKRNFKLFLEKVNELGGVPILIRTLDMSNTIPDRKITITFLAYFAARLLDLSNEINAARIIQLTWRKKRALKERRLHEIRNQAATTIQRWVRLFLRTLKMKKYASHVLSIQKFYRGYAARLRVRNIRNQQRDDAARKIQSWWRVILARRVRAVFLRRVICIQASYRCYRERRRYLELCNHVRLIQSKWRGLKETRKLRAEYLHQVNALVKIQSAFRAFIHRRRFLKLKKATLTLQSRWRRLLHLKRLERQRESAAVILQAQWLGLRQRRLYKKRLASVLLIQRRFRSYLSLKKARNEYVRKIEMATRIQAFIRGRRERVLYMKLRTSTIKLQSNYRSIKCQRHFKAIKNATIVIQRWYRKVLKTKRMMLLEEKSARTIQTFFKFVLQRNQYFSLKNSTLTIQRRWRALLEKRASARYLEAVQILQRNWRIFIARKKIKEETSKIIKVQSIVRRFLAWRELKRRKMELNNRHYAAVVIQSLFRAHSQRLGYLKLRSTACFIQERWKYLRLIKEKRRLRNIVRIQSLVRGYLAKKEYLRQKFMVRLELASIVVQSAIRGYVQRCKYLRLRRAVIFVQERHRYLVAIKKQNYIKSVIKIQSWVRRYLAQKELSRRMSLVNRHYGASVIQAAFRGYIQRRRYLKLKNATRLIQERWRYLETTRNLRRVIRIQSLVRGYLARKEYKKVRNGVIIIQSIFRRHFQRRSYLKLKSATTFVQERRWFNKEMRKKKLYISNVIKVQSLVRRFLTQKGYAKRKQLVNEAAVHIQSTFRGYIQRQRYARLRNSVLFIQQRWKYLRTLREKRKRIRIVKVQSVVRRYLARKEYLQLRHEASKMRASVAIQSAFRSHIQRHRYARLRNSVLFIQQRWKYLRTLREKRKRIRIVKVQSLVRRYLARKEYLRRKSEALTRESASVTIQSVFRGYVQRRRYLRLKNAVRLVQARMRYLMAVERTRKVVKVQTLVRGYFAKKRLQQRREDQHNRAACTIQSILRGCAQRRRYLELKRTAVFIQERCRFLQAQKKRIYILRVIKAQSLVRSYLAKKELARRRLLKKEHCAAVVIQSVFRGFIERRKWLEINNAARFIQDRWSYLKRLKNIIRVQAFIRGYIARKEYRQGVDKRNSSCVIIQSAFRGYVQRRQFLKLKNVVCFVQRRWRLLEARQRAILNDVPVRVRDVPLDKDSAASLIQRNTRAWFARKKFKKVIHSIVVIQSCWRGYWTRKRLISNTRLSEVRARLVCANKEATENKKLCNRVSYVLYHLYDIKSLAVLIKIVNDLDASTRYSEVCCDQMLEDGDRKPVVVLLDLIGRCNKSVPHIEVISGVLDTLINLARYERTRLYLAGLQETIKTCMDTLHRFEKNHSLICAKVFSFLYVLTYEEKGRDEINKLTKRLKEYLREYERKKQLLQRGGPRSKMSKGKRTIPHTPEWMCTKGFTRHFEDPIIALKALLDRLS